MDSSVKDDALEKPADRTPHRYRTTASLSYTPQAICIACFYATALLHSPPPDAPAPPATEGAGMPEAETEIAEDVAACLGVLSEWQQGSHDTWLHDLSVSIDDIYGKSSQNYSIFER